MAEEGEIPYRDFFTFLPPGSFLFIASLFRLFGVSLLAARLTTLAISTLIVSCVYLLARRVLKLEWALLSAGAVLFFGVPAWLLESHHWHSTSLGLLAVVIFPLFLDREAGKGRFRLLLAGFLAGMVVFFLQTKGILLWMAFLAFLFIVPGMAKGIVPFLLGSGTSALLFLIYITAQGVLLPFFESTILWIPRNYPSLGAVPYFHDGFEELLKHLARVREEPLLAFHVLSNCIHLALLGILAPLGMVWTLVYLAFKRSPGEEEARAMRTLFLLLLTGAALFVSVLSRPDITHLSFAFPIPAILFFFSLQTGLEKMERRIKKSWLLGGKGILILLFLSSFFYSLWDGGVFKEHTFVSFPRGRVSLTEEEMASDYQLLSATLLEEGSPEEALFAYPYMPLWYFLTNRRNPTSLIAAIEGHHTPEQLNRLVEELERDPPPLLLYGPLGKGSYGMSRDEGFGPLSIYVAKNYSLQISLVRGKRDESSSYSIQVFMRRKR